MLTRRLEDWAFSEDDLIDPDTPYGRSKLEAEKLVLHGGFVPEPVVLRLCMVYGAGGNLMIRWTDDRMDGSSDNLIIGWSDVRIVRWSDDPIIGRSRFRSSEHLLV